MSRPPATRRPERSQVTGKRQSASRPCTIYDVAREAGVSIKTVSRVLNREPNVRPATRDGVLRAVESLQFRPNTSARRLAGSRSYLLGLLIDNPSAAYVGEVQFGAMDCCREHGYHLVVEALRAGSADASTRLRSLIADLRLDGVLLTPPACDDPEILGVLEALEIDYVRISPGRYPQRSAFVEIDDKAASQAMATHVLDLGHSDIGYVEGPPEHAASRLRRQGFVDALKDRGLTIRDAWLRQGDFSFGSGLQAAEAMLTGRDRPSAIIAGNDDMALGIMACARQLGLALPEALSVAGFDDSPAATIVRPSLTTVRQPVALMAHTAAGLLIAGRRDAPASGPERRRLDFSVEARESTLARRG